MNTCHHCNRPRVFTLGCKKCNERFKDWMRVELNEKELLPAGEWTVESNGTGRSNWDYGEDPERFHFLEKLGPLTRIITFYAFGSRKGRRGSREYRAYIFERGTDGRQIALVETDTTQNATYAFWADEPGWREVAERTKLDILTGSYPEFVTRMSHTETWQSRVKELVA